jgi:hypothetical protein
VSARGVERDLRRVAALSGCAELPGLRACAAAPTRLARARSELSRVQRAELALLLRRAAASRLAYDARAEPALADPTLAAGLGEALELARQEGWNWPRRLERLALLLRAQPAQRWPDALRLARTAHALAPCPASRELVADALAAAGRPREALAGLARALARLPRGARPARLVAALERQLARAGACGDVRLARVCARLLRALAAERAA